MLTCLKVIVSIVFALLAFGPSPTTAQPLVYSHQFELGTAYPPGSAQFDDWMTYRAALPPAGITSITVSGSLDSVGRTCSDPAKAQQIADAMRAGAGGLDNIVFTLAISCDGLTWSLGACSGNEGDPNNLEITVGPGSSMCECHSNGYYTVRPGIFGPALNPAHWGGVGGTDCHAPTQILTVTANVLSSSPDHYLSYKTKATKGDICSDESAAGKVGKSCQTEEECGGSSDPDTKTAFCLPNKFPKSLRVTVSDALDASNRLYDVKKPLGLYTPADKSFEGVQDPNTHLRSYLIALTNKRCSSEAAANPGVACTTETDCGGIPRVTTFCQRQPTFNKQTHLRVENQFHSGESPLIVDATKIDRLLVPTSKGLTEPLPPPEFVDVDHYRCYTVAVTKGTGKFVPILGVSVKDQFTEAQIPPEGQKRFDLKKLTRLCLAADKNTEGVVNASAALLCYQAVPAKLQPKHQPVKGLFLANQFGPEQADTIKEDELCVPSQVTIPSPT